MRKDYDRKKIQKILEKITTPEEMSGILKWALEGLKRLNEQEDFTKRLSVEETRDYYKRLVSPAYTFVTDDIIETENPDDYIPKDYLWEVLLNYCKENSLPKPTSKKQIAYIIKRNFRNIKTAQRIADKPRTYVWTNCKFADDKKQMKYLEWFYEVTGGSQLSLEAALSS